MADEAKQTKFGRMSSQAEAPAPQSPSQPRAVPGHSSIFAGVIASLTRRPATVYPSYLAMRIKKALVAGDPDHIIESVDEIETIGDCRYAIRTTDHLGNRYRVTVEVE